jgi:multicomponent Na+:H+ antiporter subunit F
VSQDALFYGGIVWVAILLGIVVVKVATSRTTGQKILALDLLGLVLIGLLALVAGEDQRAYALDAGLALALLSFIATLGAARYYENRRPFE